MFLFLTEIQKLSFITGLAAGMLIIQIFFHRFDKPLAPEQSPESGAPPRKIMSYAIKPTQVGLERNRCDDGLFAWALYALVGSSAAARQRSA